MEGRKQKRKKAMLSFTKNSRPSKLASRLLCSIVILLMASGAANSAILLEIDLSQEDIIRINATNNSALVNSVGTDFTGVYLEDFFASAIVLNEVLLQGNLVTANQLSDNSPNLFNSNGDLGLNIFSMTDENSITTTVGQAAFSSFAIFAVGSDVFQSALNGALSGNLHMNADTIGDLSDPAFNSQLIGSWAVVSEVPAPSVLLLMLIAACSIFRIRKRAN